MKEKIATYNTIMDNAMADHLLFTDEQQWTHHEMIENVEGILAYYTDTESGMYIEAHENIEGDTEGDQKRRYRRWQAEKEVIEKFLERYKAED